MPRLPLASIRWRSSADRGQISGVVETTPSSPAPPVLQRVLAEGTVHVLGSHAERLFSVAEARGFVVDERCRAPPAGHA
jgi:hypothetical protein